MLIAAIFIFQNHQNNGASHAKIHVHLYTSSSPLAICSFISIFTLPGIGLDDHVSQELHKFDNIDAVVHSL